jgi:hypothetical protein
MLVMLCCNLRCNVDLMSRVERLIGLQTIGIDNPSSLDFELNRTVQGEVEVEAVFVIGDCADR